jgi:hypothetical protein
MEPIKAIAAKTLFRFVLPRISELAPEEILDLREKLSDFRAGFSYHLQSLCGEIFEAIRSGANMGEVTAHASALVEIKILPDLHEYQSQLSARRTRSGERILDTVGRVLRIEASPWTPRFFGDVLEAVAPGLLEANVEREARASNKGQALQFLAALTKMPSRDVAKPSARANPLPLRSRIARAFFRAFG